MAGLVANKGKRDLSVELGLTRARVRRASSRVCPDRARYEENASRIDLGLARTSARNGRDRALRIGSRAPSLLGEGVFLSWDLHRSRRRLLGALFREKTYAQDAICAVSGRYPCQAGIGRGRVGPPRWAVGASEAPVPSSGRGLPKLRSGKYGPSISEHRFVSILVCHSGADAVARNNG